MTDIIDRLRTVASSADHLWLADLLSEAADTIEKMRGLGVATVGAGFAEVTKDMRRIESYYEPADTRESSTN